MGHFRLNGQCLPAMLSGDTDAAVRLLFDFESGIKAEDQAQFQPYQMVGA